MRTFPHDCGNYLDIDMEKAWRYALENFCLMPSFKFVHLSNGDENPTVLPRAGSKLT